MAGLRLLRLGRRGDLPANPPVFDPDAGQFALWPLGTNKPRLARGSRGDAVRYLQGVIHHKAGGDIVIDGIFEAQTDRRVRDVQRMFRITIDGVVGPETWPVIDFLANR